MAIALDFYVLVAYLTKKRISRWTHSRLTWNYAGRFDCIHLSICQHQFTRSQTSTKMFIFSFFFLFENSLLVLMWMIGIWIDKRKKNWHMTPIWIFHSFLHVESMHRWPFIHDPDYDLWFQYYQCVIIFCITFFILPAKSFFITAAQFKLSNTKYIFAWKYFHL